MVYFLAPLWEASCCLGENLFLLHIQSLILCSAQGQRPFALLNRRDEEHEHVDERTESKHRTAGKADVVLRFRVSYKVSEQHHVVHDQDQFYFIKHVHEFVKLLLAHLNVAASDHEHDACLQKYHHLQPRVRLSEHDYDDEAKFAHILQQPENDGLDLA